ncbi:dynein regulatory complex protein 1 [Halichoeres trimaculatus]|uniref:dynein regulatory complex protein 1 n=1 Tax=Halichoeres trimaculatus TaxID=147232 RepID=UPI003D9EFDEE
MDESDEDLKKDLTEDLKEDLQEGSGPGNEEQESGSSSQDEDAEEEEVPEETEGGEKMVLPQRILDLQRQLPTYVSDIQTEADNKESLRRKQQEEADRLRLEKQEDDLRLSEEKFEEISQGWSTANQKRSLWEQKEVLRKQKELCSAFKEDKRRRISELQQELKSGDDLFVRDLKKKSDVLGLMMERIEEQTKTLLKTFREELAVTERASQQESDDILQKDETAWEKFLKELCDGELAWLTQKQREMKERSEEVEEKLLNTTEQFSDQVLERDEKMMVKEREVHKLEATEWLASLKQKNNLIMTTGGLAPMRAQLINSSKLKVKLGDLRTQRRSQQKQFTERRRQLLDQNTLMFSQCERTLDQIQHFAAVDEKRFAQMWPVIDEEVKQLVEVVLVLDSLIWEQHLGLAWERPHVEFMERSGPIQTQKQAQSLTHQVASESSLAGQSGVVMDASVRPSLETETEEAAVQSEGGAEEEEEEEDLSDETMKKVMELLCDESGFLLDEDTLGLLAPMETEEQTVVKLGSLLSAFGIEDDDVPRLARFLMKYKTQQREQTEDVCAETGGDRDGEEVESHVTPNRVVPALKSFLEQHVRSSEDSEREELSFQQEAAWDAPEDEAYWRSLGSIISEDRETLWDTAERKIQQHHEGLTDLSKLVTDVQSLEQQNAVLRMMLQQDLRSLLVDQQTAWDTETYD